MIQQIFRNLLDILSNADLVADHGQKGIALVHVLLPDSIAADYDEFVVFATWELLDVGFAGYHLAGPVEVCVLLVVEVSERTR